jgi:hypothetical protein
MTLRLAKDAENVTTQAEAIDFRYFFRMKILSKELCFIIFSKKEILCEWIPSIVCIWIWLPLLVGDKFQ